MAGPVSSKALFRATKPKPKVAAGQGQLAQWAEDPKPAPLATRDPLDFDPTPPDATRAALAVLADRMRRIGGPVWEPAVGDGRIAQVLQADGFDVIGSDIVDRGWPGTVVRSLYDWTEAPAPIVFTNPPYGEINARDGHGRWLRHLMGLQPRLVIMLLSADWPFARQNGMDALHGAHPVSVEYRCCWKIDFRGAGSPPQRNSWFVWDAEHQGETVVRRLYREAGTALGQGALL